MRHHTTTTTTGPITGRLTRWMLTLALGPGLSLGCYSGIGDGAQGGGGDQGAAEGEAEADGNGNGEAGEDDGPPTEPEPGDAETPFNVPSDEARLLPFPVRMQNLAQVTGQPLEHPMFLALFDLRYQLGDHDFASGVAPDLRWSSEKMQSWVRGIKPVCQSAEMQATYPDLLTDPRPLMRQAWGHEPSAEEVEALADLQGGELVPEEQYLVTCIAVLTSLDFVSI